MASEVNYIRHLECVAENFVEDERLTPWHISLYYALFHSWNCAKFQNPLSINRTEMMQAAKIGSVNTYTKALKQLHLWGYIEYFPSRSALKGSIVHMLIFDTSGDTTADTTADTSGEILLIQQVSPSINNKKHYKPSKQKSEKRYFSAPLIAEIQSYFEEQNAPPEQANQFFDHFTSNGWLIGGKTKMKDWQAAARNWIRRSTSFRTSSVHPEQRRVEAEKRAPNNGTNYLHADQNTDYSIPL